MTLTDCIRSRNLPKAQYTLYVYTLTLLTYFSGASHTISYTLYDYISFLHVSLSLYILSLKGKSQKPHQQAFLVFEIRENEWFRGQEWVPCDFPFLSHSKGMWLQRMFLSSVKSFSQKKLIKEILKVVVPKTAKSVFIVSISKEFLVVYAVCISWIFTLLA